MHNKCKDTIFRGLVFCTVIFLSIIIYAAAALVCPSVSVEYGSTRVISCESDRAISDFYWYRGHYSNSTPILILDTAGKGGTEYGSEHFDILPNGSMVLTDVKTEHESYYSFVGYYENRQFERATFLVNVTISPDPPCPLIHGCNACTECDVFGQEETGTLTCEIEGGRPLLPLNWKIISQTGVNFVKNPPIVHRNAEIDSWDMSVSLGYTITDPCKVSGEVKCVAKDHSGILQKNTSTVKIKKTDFCKNTVSTKFSPLAAGLASVATIVVVIGVICAVTGYIRFTRRTLFRGGVKEMVYYNVMSLLPCKKVKVKLLVRSLKKAYAKYCELKPLPWSNIPISVADLYTDCQCTVWDKTISTTELINDTRKIIREKRVIVIGDHGTGRTTFSKYIVNQWIHDDKGTCLLLYIPLREVALATKLSDFVLRDLPRSTSMKNEDIEKVLICGRIRCLVILDGLEDLSKSCNENKIDMEDKEEEEEEEAYDNVMPQTHSITIGQLLEGNLKDNHTNVHVWLTSRKVDYETSTLSEAHGTKVTMIGFSEDQILEYINKCCVYYSRISSKQQNLLVDNIGDGASGWSYDSDLESIKLCDREGEITKSKQSDVSIRINKKVQQFIEQNDICEDFRTTPLLLNITVHVMAGKYTSAINYLKDKVITNVSTLMRIIINCMEERYVQKNTLLEKDFMTVLERKVGEFAYNNIGQLVDRERKFWVQIGKDYFNASLEIGLLRLSESAAAGATEMTNWANPSSAIEFYHPHIRDYLVAEYVGDNTERFQTILKKLEQDRSEKSYKIFTFISRKLKEVSFQQLCEVLKTHEKYNILIDCLHENGNYGILKTILKNSADIQIHISHLESTYHSKAVQTFCNKCNESEIKLGSISFEGDRFMRLLQNLYLPHLDSVDFYRMELSAIDFQNICDWLTKIQVTDVLRFKECKLPKNIARDHEEVVGEPSGTEIYHQGNSTVTFNYSKVTESWGSSGTAV